MNSYETLSEYYDRFTDDVGYEGIHREKARMALRSLLQELDG